MDECEHLSVFLKSSLFCGEDFVPFFISLSSSTHISATVLKPIHTQVTHASVFTSYRSLSIFFSVLIYFSKNMHIYAHAYIRAYIYREELVIVSFYRSDIIPCKFLYSLLLSFNNSFR